MKESGEMYLETILVLLKTKQDVRAIDVAEKMEHSKPAVSRALAKLKEQDYIVVDRDGFITLTETGREIAGKIYERHTTIAALLMHIGVDEETAAADACKIEHVISDSTFELLKKYSVKQQDRE